MTAGPDTRHASPPRHTPGPLGTVLTVHEETRGEAKHWRLRGAPADANSRVVISRTAFEGAPGALDSAPVLAWAESSGLGQSQGLVTAVAARRTAALADLAEQGYGVLRLIVEPTSPLVVGHGDHLNAYETGLALHGTYGWPYLPGSALKGLSDAYARVTEDLSYRREVLGSPRPKAKAKAKSGSVEAGTRDVDTASEPSQPASRGRVQFLDALAAAKPVTVRRDVLTPHVQPYYTSTSDRSTAIKPPAEYYHPIPVEFLAVTAGAFAVDLIGLSGEEEFAAAWLTAALNEYGIGAKTSAGYGYATATPSTLPSRAPVGEDS